MKIHSVLSHCTLILIIGVFGTISLHAQMSSCSRANPAMVLLRRLHDLKSSDESLQATTTELAEIVDSLLVITQQEDFIATTKNSDPDIRIVHGTLFRLAEKYDESLKCYRGILEDETNQQERIQIARKITDILMEKFHYKRPYYMDHLYGKQLVYYGLDHGVDIVEKDQISFLRKIGEFELARVLLDPIDQEVSFDEQLSWKQQAIIRLIKVEHSEEELIAGLASAIITPPKKLNREAATCALSIFGYDLLLHIPSLQREEFNSSDEENRQRILRWVFENTTFYKQLAGEANE
ncbi:MAG: hypothetical protein AAFZ63_09200 [Bacteroidota bacterium]